MKSWRGIRVRIDEPEIVETTNPGFGRIQIHYPIGYNYFTPKAGIPVGGGWRVHLSCSNTGHSRGPFSVDLKDLYIDGRIFDCRVTLRYHGRKETPEAIEARARSKKGSGEACTQALQQLWHKVHYLRDFARNEARAEAIVEAESWVEFPSKKTVYLSSRIRMGDVQKARRNLMEKMETYKSLPKPRIEIQKSWEETFKV